MCRAVDNAWNTAIGRTEPSKPMRYLLRHDFIDLMNDRVLDFGCGRGFDAATYMIEKYDPHFFPKRPRGKFDVVVCSYVLNVLPKKYECDIMNEVMDYLNRIGTAFITVRRNIKKQGYTAKGTYQRNVVLTGVPSVYRDSDMEIYRVGKITPT